MTRACLVWAILLICAAIAAAQEVTNCSYVFITKTGNQENASTDGLINVVFGKDTQFPYQITDLATYGITCSGHTCFQRNRLDFFRFNGPCDLRCPLDLQYTLRGNDRDWYVEYFIIAASLSQGNRIRSFRVNKWFTGGYDHFLVGFCENTTSSSIPVANNAGLAMPS